MCEDESKKYGQFIDLDERFYDGRWSILLTANKYKEAALCYMIIQYISTYYIHIFGLYNLYYIGTNDHALFMTDVKGTIEVVELECIKKNALSKYFKNSNSGKILRNIMREIDTRVLQRQKDGSGINDIKNPTKVTWEKRSNKHFGPNGRRGTMTSMFAHYHRQMYAKDGYTVTLTAAIDIIIQTWKNANKWQTGGKKRSKLTKRKSKKSRNKKRINRKNSKVKRKSKKRKSKKRKSKKRKSKKRIR